MISREDLACRLNTAVQQLIEINACKSHIKSEINDANKEANNYKNEIKNFMMFQRTSAEDVSKLKISLEDAERKICNVKDKIAKLSIQEIQLSDQVGKTPEVLCIDGTIRDSPYIYLQRLNSQLICQKSMLKRSIDELELLKHSAMCYTKYDDQYLHENEFSGLITGIDDIQANSEDVSDELQSSIQHVMNNIQASDVHIYKLNPNIINSLSSPKYEEYIENRPNQIYDYMEDASKIIDLLEKAKASACNGASIASITKIYSLVIETKELIMNTQKRLNHFCELSPESYQKLIPLNESFTRSKILVDSLISKINIFYEINKRKPPTKSIKQIECKPASELQFEQLNKSQLKEIYLLDSMLRQSIARIPEPDQIFKSPEKCTKENSDSDDLGYDFTEQINEIIELQKKIAENQDMCMNEISEILEKIEDYNHEEDEAEDDESKDENEESVSTEDAKLDKQESRLVPKFESKPLIKINPKVEIRSSYSSGGKNSYSDSLKQMLKDFHNSMIPPVTEKVTALREAVSIVEKDYNEALNEMERRISRASERLHKAKSENSKLDEKIKSSEDKLSSSSLSLKALREAAMQSRSAREATEELERLSRETERIQAEIHRKMLPPEHSERRSSDHSDRRTSEHSDRRVPEHSERERRSQDYSDRRRRGRRNKGGE